MGTFLKRRTKLAENVALLLLCALFFILAVGAIATGVSAYSKVSATVDKTNDMRTAMAYFSNQLRLGDANGGMEKTFVFGRDALCLNEYIDQGGEVYVYSTFIYCYDGYLRELYTEKGLEADMGPEAGEELMPLSGLDISLENGIIKIAVTIGDQVGRVIYSPRSAGLAVTK